jgi:hypothetical protein
MPRRKPPRLRRAAYLSERNRRSASAWDQEGFRPLSKADVREGTYARPGTVPPFQGRALSGTLRSLAGRRMGTASAIRSHDWRCCPAPESSDTSGITVRDGRDSDIPLAGKFETMRNRADSHCFRSPRCSVESRPESALVRLALHPSFITRPALSRTRISPRLCCSSAGRHCGMQ